VKFFCCERRQAIAKLCVGVVFLSGVRFCVSVGLAVCVCVWYLLLLLWWASTCIGFFTAYCLLTVLVFGEYKRETISNSCVLLFFFCAFFSSSFRRAHFTSQYFVRISEIIFGYLPE
jgi:hypothetical protein